MLRICICVFLILFVNFVACVYLCLYGYASVSFSVITHIYHSRINIYISLFICNWLFNLFFFGFLLCYCDFVILCVCLCMFSLKYLGLYVLKYLSIIVCICPRGALCVYVYVLLQEYLSWYCYVIIYLFTSVSLWKDASIYHFIYLYSDDCVCLHKYNSI